MYRKKTVYLYLFLIGILSFLLYCFSWSSDEQEVPILKTQNFETKKRPKEPGGLIIPNSDSLVYQKINFGKEKNNIKIKFLSDPECPVEIIQNIKFTEIKLDPIDEILKNIEYYEGQIENIEYKQKDSDEYIMPNSLVKNENLNNEVFFDGEKLNVTSIDSNRHKFFSENFFSSKPQEYKIRLSSAISSSEAKKQWESIKKRHYKILSNSDLILKKINSKNGKVFYVIMAGPYDSLNIAKAICKQLSVKKQSCIVVK